MSVEFADAVSAYAEALLAARRTLDAASARLAQVYAADETLMSLPTPAFRLAEAEFEMPYVVDEIVTEAEERLPELPRRTVVKLNDRELASLLRGVDDFTRDRFGIFLDQYQRLVDIYERARQDPRVLRQEALPGFQRPDTKDLRLLRTGASATSRQRLDRLLDDIEEVWASLDVAAQTIKEGPRTRVFVRLDAGALAEVPPDRVQRARLRFRDLPTTRVDVDGQPVVIPE